LDLEGHVRLPAGLILSFVGFFGAFSSVTAQGPPPVPPSAPQPPRDVVRRMESGATGTGVIRGRVVAADTGNPIRRASVNLSPMNASMPPGGGRGVSGGMPVMVSGIVSGRSPQTSASASMARPRQATTDSQGGFEFTGLPAGSYRIFASASQYSPQYLGMAYGGKKPNGPGSSDLGQPVQLTDGQTFDKAVITLSRGGVITGRVTDETGDPVTRVQVYTIFFAPGSTRGMRMGSGSQTDDLGQFRIYGLQPGEHAVVAEASRFNFVSPNAPPETEEDKIGFVTTYYPGTPDEGAAQRVRTRVGTETTGIEIRLLQDRLYRISGSVVDSQGQPLPHVNGQVMRRTTGTSGMSSFGFNTDEKGQFQMRNVPSGNYRLIVRQTRPYTPGPGPQTDLGEMANMPLTIAGADVDNVLVMTTPGVTITGHVVFEQGPPQGGGQVRVMAMVGNPDDMSGVQSPQPALVKPDLTFTMKGLMGDLMLRASAPNQYLKSVTVGGDDITDSPREFKASDRVTITLTSRASTLEGNVVDGSGAPSTDAGIMLFSDDKASWRFNSSRMRRSTSDPNGHFRILGLMPGRYLIVAVPRDRLSMPMTGDTAMFEELSKVATSITVGEDEERRIDLKLVAGNGAQ
jgi:hypothetical protein